MNKSFTAEDRSLAAWEIVAASTSALAAEWVVGTLAGRGRLLLLIPVTTAVALMLLSHHVRGESAREIGWRVRIKSRIIRRFIFRAVSLVATLKLFKSIFLKPF